MRKRTLLLFASLFVFLVGILVMPADLTYAKEQTKKQSNISNKRAGGDSLASLRALYQDKTRFKMLSSAGQLALERRLGIKTNAVRSQRITQLKSKKPQGGLANVLVNDPGADATAQDTQSETTIILSGPNIVAGFNDSGSFIGGQAHFTGVSYSSDGGASFTDIGALPASTEGDAGDPALARNDTTGRLYLTTLGFNTFTVLQIFRSDDNGVTWMPPVSCCFQTGGEFQDKEWVAVDNVAGAGQGNVYIAWRSFGDGIYFVRSTDHGDTWSSPIKVADQGAFNVQGAFVVTGPNHEIYVAYIDNQSDGSNNFIKVAKSTDLGLSFSPGVTVAQLLTAGVNGDLGLSPGFRSNAFPHAVVNPANGDVYVAWNDDVSGTDKADIFYSASTDGGATWSTATNISDLFDSGTNDDWQPSIAITPSGAQAFIGWYDRELDGSNNLIDWFGAVATVGSGVLNFLPQQRISNTSFPPAFGQDPVVNSVYMGDYDTAVADNGFLHTLWGDNRDGNGFHANQPDVRYAKITLGPTGTLQGTVTDSSTSNPIQGAKVDVTPGGGSTTTDANGFYSLVVPIGTYDVTASAFGYLPETVNGVVITDGGTTTQDFALDQAPISTVTGTVTDNSGHGWPLYARIDIDGYPNGPVFTNAVTGVYSVDLPQGTTFTFHVNAVVPGYFEEERDVLPGQNPTEDFGLEVDGGNCNAPGYGFGTSSQLFFDNFEGGFGNWTMDGLWNPENEGDACGSLVAPFPSSSNDAYYGIDGVCNFDTGSTTVGSLTQIVPISVPASGKATLTFWSYEQTECGGASCPYDARFVEVSTNGGTSWTFVGEGDTENVWYQKSFSLAPYSGQDILVRFHFDSVDGAVNQFFGWMVDDVDISVTQCEAIPGGLIVGNVFDLNTGDGLNGAKVTSDEAPAEQATTFGTPEDPNEEDGFYVLFSSLTGPHDFTASKNLFGSQTLNIDVASEGIVVQDFQLGTAHLVATPPSFEETVDFGTQLTKTMTITNDGSADGTFELQEGNGLSFKIKNQAATKRGAGTKAKRIKGHFSPLSVLKAGKDLSKKKGAAFKRGPNDAPWTDIAGFPTAVMDSAAVEVNGLVYNVNGIDGGLNFLNTLYAYDPGTDSWTQLASSSAARERPAVAAIDGLIYVTNGWDSSGQPTASLEIYDPSTDTWTTGAPNTAPMGGGSTGVTFDGKFYVIGGCTGSCGFTNVQVYDPATDSWSAAADYPEPISWQGCGDVGGQIVCAGGTATGTTANTYSYDPGANAWTPVAPMPQDQWAMGYVASGGLLYVSGGVTDGFNTITNEGFVYDPGADSWTPIENSNNVVYRGAGACGFYRIGGSIGGFSPIPNAEVYPGLTDCGGSSDVPWLSENPVTATVPQGGSVDVDVTFDAAQVDQPGDYFAHITVKTDTPYPAQKVDVTMHVPLPDTFGTLEGTVTGLGQCDVAGGPINKATVFIDGPLADYTLETDASGHYTWSFDAANSPVDVTVSAAGYVGETQTGIVITAGQTTTADFELRLDAPCLSVDPTSLDQIINLGGLATQQITITNTGAGDSDFKIRESGGATFKQTMKRGEGAKLQLIKGNFSPLSVLKAGKDFKKTAYKRGPSDAPWTDIAGFPTAIMDSAAVEVNGLIYNVNGIDGGLNFLNTLYAYDPGTDSWTQLASSSAARERPAVVAIDGLIYVTNGWDSSGNPTASLEIYDPSTDTWTSGAPNTVPMGGGSTGVTFDGKFYVIGGCTGSCGFTNVQVYDPATDSWSSAADYPEPISWQGCGDVGGQIVCAGGTATGTTANTYSYDPGTNAWTPVAPMPQDQWAMGYVASGGLLYVSGGVTDGFNTITNEGFVYDPATDAWTAIENSNNTVYRGAGACGFYRIGGSIGGFSPIPNSEVYPGLTECGGGGDVPWLSEDPAEGNIPPGGQVTVDVTFDASQVTELGDYFAQLKISGNAPGASPTVDVAMHVVDACTYSQDFNDATMEWIEEKPTVTQPGDGFLHLDPLKKKAIAVADSSFGGGTTGTYVFVVQFTGGPDAKNWIYTHRVDKKNQMEVLFKIEQGKVVVKDRGPGGVEAKAKADFALAPNTPYTVSIAYNGTAYAVVIDGTTVISGFSPIGALPNANIGAAAKNNSMLLDNVCVNTP